ncbi:hypothetical protein SAMN05421770_105201 [Granulicella rosea]|uniref:Two component regulator propeller n=1 Tax=Granulicella rosea TaxID=474952 RepID=A0A239KW35_9BACT|nr:hypothetical protein [Granulicella rosea]SNT21464.1 hypothetical protein SAMN05421770_105201 [Granulicella rosea]
MRRPPTLVLVALPTALLAGAIAFAFMHAQHVLSRAGVTAARQHLSVFELRTLDPAAMAAANPGFEPIAAPASFVSGAFFHGDLYLSGPAGLYDYTPEGVLRRAWRTGLDLPAAPLGALAVGRLRGASDRQLLIATAGEGVLILGLDARNSPEWSQLRAEDAELRDVTALLPLPTGELLIGTHRHGLQLYTGTTLEPFRAEVAGLNTAALQVTSLAADAAGFWVGTRNAGLLRAHGGTVEHLDTAAGLPDQQVDSLAVVEGHVYAGTPLGVAEFAASGAETRLARTLAPGMFAHALEAGTKLLTVGTIDQGVRQVALDGAPRLRAISNGFDQASPEEPVQQFVTSGDETYAITQHAVLRRAGSGWTTAIAGAQAALTDGNVSALAFAPDGRLWVGFFDRGLDVLSPALERAEHLEDDRIFCVNRLVLDPRRQTMAVATANGLVLFDAAGKPRQTLTQRDGLIADHVNDIAFTAQGMAVATPAGISFVDPGGTQSLYAFQGLVNNHVYALGVRGGSLLAGTLGGLSLLRSEAVERSLTIHNSGLRHNWITAIAPGPEGSWMIGTYGAGVMQLVADGSVRAMENATSATQDLIINPNAMLATKTHIYAGTLGRGLLVYTLANGRWSTLTQGLPSENVTALAEREGQLYVGTESGLVRIAEGKLSR